MALSESEKKQEKKEKPPTKIVVRRLPPTIDQETFLKQVSPVPDYNYVYTVNGDSSLGEFAFSRVYFNFVNHEDVYNFKERFDNYVFLDSKGQEYPCVVEFASFQKIPKKRGKIRMDPKAGSIESDPVFLDFVESLKKTPEPEEKAEYTLQLTNENKNDLTTPLLEYLKNKRAQRMKIREVRREERKKREFDKRKERFDERKKTTEERSPTKEAKPRPKQEGSKTDKVEESEKRDKAEEKVVKSNERREKAYSKSEKEYEKSERGYEKSSYYKNKERKYEDKRYFDERRKEIKLRYPKKDYSDGKGEDPKVKDAGTSQRMEYKKEVEPKPYPKKVKKYSEKREERKMEAQKKNEQKNIDQDKEDAPHKSEPSTEKKLEEKTQKSEEKTVTQAKEEEVAKEVPTPIVEKSLEKSKEPSLSEREGHNQRRIRNKDRPTIAIYRPGMLSKRKQNDPEPSNESKDSKTEEKNA
ncbi:unnamed protein product [Phaedon cochleariae]|uniref:UPF3 domain-containing protein n=1 Tax=Phaedon cochleariae TaxID=80249 RepID=A0A9P0DYH6_PHACE|nr:unnamed protein product [Phaedon cochleariae]